MQKKGKFFFIFFIFLLLSALILALSFYGMLSGSQPFLEKTISFLPKTVHSLLQNLPFISESDEIKKIKEENLDLISKLVDREKLKKENAALLSQFQTQNPKPENLLPANIVGAPEFIPNVSEPSEIILDRGEKDNVAAGQSVVFKNNLVGKVSKTSYNLSKVDLVTKTSITFPAETIKGATGIIKGEGEEKMTLQNVLPSENLEIGDIVMTKGDVDLNGSGLLPGLIVGKIESIEKIPTAIFQKAEVRSLVDFGKLSVVFVIVGGE